MLFKFGKSKPLPPVMKMIVPGRRALGEEWSEVTVRPNVYGGFDLENNPAPAPAMGQPVFIPAMANLSNEECDFIMEGALKAQDYESHRPKRRPVTDAEVQKLVQQMWMEYCEKKLKSFLGTSTFGLGGHTQRQGAPDELKYRNGVR